MLPPRPSKTPPLESCWVRRLTIAGLLVATFFGASQLAFLCDDAFIHFRYAVMAHAGHGLVWNPAPFQPVEGGGFLWILALWCIWSWFGVEPVHSANPFLIGCGLVQVLIVAAAANRLCGRDGARLPAVVGLCALAAIVGNRTFLQWMSSGLDTAMFNVFLLGWVLHAFRARERRDATWLAAWAGFAALGGLVRPDGYPLVAATVGTAALSVLRRRRAPLPTFAALSPLLLVVAHVLWRRAYYGEWLPNTYFAKVVGAWPEAGWRYFACFALENGAWLWLPIVGLWLVCECRRAGSRVFAAAWDHVPAVAAVAVTLFNAGYYLLAVGGDHFEYRVLAHLVPLGVLACVAMTARLADGPRLPIATALALGLAGCAGWVHLAATRGAPAPGLCAVAPHVPAAVRPIARWFDRQQAWLFVRYICMRRDNHVDLLEKYTRLQFGDTAPHPVTIADPPDPFPMLATGAVGLPSYWLRDCAILDVFGLNDWVVARTQAAVSSHVMPPETFRRAVESADVDHDGYLDVNELRTAIAFATDTALDTSSNAGGVQPVFDYLITVYATDRPDRVALADAVDMSCLIDPGRQMAHERRPPPGYVEAFEPNVTFAAGTATAAPRRQPMTADRIRAIEAEWFEKIRRERLGQ